MAASPPQVELRLPGVLEAVVGRDRFRVAARTVPEALEGAFAECPQLRQHLLLDSGELRPHILLVLNGECLLRSEVGTTKLTDGDELLIQQAISGG